MGPLISARRTALLYLLLVWLNLCAGPGSTHVQQLHVLHIAAGTLPCGVLVRVCV